MTNAQRVVNDSLKNELIDSLSQDEDFEYLHLGVFDDLRSVKSNNYSIEELEATSKKYQKIDENFKKKYPMLKFLGQEELFIVESKAIDNIRERRKKN